MPIKNPGPDAILTALAAFLRQAPPDWIAARVESDQYPTDPDLPLIWKPRWRLALSGGRDSCVLLQALTQLVPPENIEVFHVHHGLHPAADEHARFCRSRVESLGLVYRELRVTLNLETGEGIEAAARRARYAALAEGLEPMDCVLTAHHADDQAETFLLSALRGRGPQGLAAMPAWRRLGVGWLGRPLLSLSRGQIDDFATLNELEWCEDPTNQDDSLSRNYVRRQVWPVLRSRFAVVENFCRSAQIQREAVDLLQRALDEKLARIQRKQPRHSIETHILESGDLLAEPRTDSIWLLRRFIGRDGLHPPTREALQEFLRQLQESRSGHAAILEGIGWQLRHYDGGIYRVDPQSLPTPSQLQGRIIWPSQQPFCDLPDGRRLLRSELPSLPVAAEATLWIGFRQGGERLFQHGIHRSLKSLFQEKRIPPWRRAGIPLIYNEDRLLAALWSR